MADLTGIINFVDIDARLATAGQPTAEQLKDVAAAGYQAVMRLSMPDANPGLVGEDEIVTAMGLEYVHIPVVWTAPTWANVETFFTIMDAWQGRRLFVHCAKNYRVSVFVGLYFLARGHWTEDEVRDHVAGVFEPNGVWQAFLDDGIRRLT